MLLYISKLEIMKKVIYLLALSVMFFAFKQDQKLVPDVTVKSLDLTTDAKVRDLVKNDKGITVLSLWATWCRPCMMELEAINNNYAAWQKEGVKVVAVSIDTKSRHPRLPGLIKEKGWKFDVFIDAEGKLKDGIGTKSVPYTALVKDGKIVSFHTSYAPGDEVALLEEIKKLSK